MPTFDRGDTLNTVGCLTKIAFVLLQSLFALNSEYYFGDKGILEAIDRFPYSRKVFPNGSSIFWRCQCEQS